MFDFVKNEYDRQRCLAYLEMIIYHLIEKTGKDWNYKPGSFHRMKIGIGDNYFIRWHQGAVSRSLREDQPEEYWVDVFLKEMDRQEL